MLKFLSKTILGSYSDREVRRHQRRVEQINALEPQIEALTDAELAAKTVEFRERLGRGEGLDSLLPEAFAITREASRRVLKMRHFDVQLIGGMVLHESKIAEMKTGEGKTLVATLPAYLNALTGRGVHIVTVNDYLAKRDSEWMGQIFRFLGLSVGLISSGMDYDQRKQAYAADVTYGTNNELGFDYLRDNMVTHPEEMVQRGFYFGIVDEVDSILIDEARTPLIISGPGEESTDLYYRFAQIVPRLTEATHYKLDEKAKTVAPTEEGVAMVEKLLGVENLYADAETDLSHYLMQALKAQFLMHRDKDYVVQDGEVVIVDEFTGRLMVGRRYSDGLHQAIEAKEGVRIQQENQTLATITFQNFFRMFEKLSGMTGTALTEEEEFRKIYGMDVVVIPTHRTMCRQDLPDVVYKSVDSKFRAVVEEIVEHHATGQPILVGTVSIEKSERLSVMLQKRGIPHQVLNAKHHEREAEIIAQAGQQGMVTIATNMAGRGTDIMLGEEVPNLGGLHVIGTERHESRRIDNQLRGRSGRQGDPGSSRFYLSLEDDLMRIFANDTVKGILEKAGFEEDMPLEMGLLTRGIETAQKKVEAHNFDIRKHVLEYDDVMNKQREVVYADRQKILRGDDLTDLVLQMLEHVVSGLVEQFCTDNVHPDEWNLTGLIEMADTLFLEPGTLPASELADTGKDGIQEILVEKGQEVYRGKVAQLGEEGMQELQRVVLLRAVDSQWMAHLRDMDALREGITLRAYGQRDPLVEYKKEAFEMFEEMKAAVEEEVVRVLFKLSVMIEPQMPPMMVPPLMVVPGGGPAPDTPRRNDPCPCGSGKKYKRCHGIAS